MDFRLLALGACALVVLQYLIFLVKQLWSPLRTVPGPFWARFGLGWYGVKVWQGFFPDLNVKLHRKHGDVVRYATNRYSIDNLEAVKVIYGLGRPFAKSSWYSVWAQPGQWSLFSDTLEARHAANRRLYQSTYSMTSLKRYEPFVDKCVELFTRRLSELAAAGNDAVATVDLRHWFQCYAFDVIGVVTYAQRIGFLDCGDDIGGIIGALENQLTYATLVGLFPRLHRLLFPLVARIGGRSGSGFNYVVRFTEDRIRDARANLKSVPEAADEGKVAAQSFLDRFLDQQAADPAKFTAHHVLTGCLSNMVAGSDTTAISLSAVLYYLLKNPRCMQALRAEVDTYTAENGLSAFPKFAEAQKMPYLQAVIKEALRLHPATGLPLERVVPKNGAMICGHFFPEGVIVGINVWVAHRNKAVFGDDADVFSPERWLDSDAEKLAAMNRYWAPFGHGSRTCIGRHISMLEMTKLVPLLVRDFDFSLDSTLAGREWNVFTHWFTKPMDFKATIRFREQSYTIES